MTRALDSARLPLAATSLAAVLLAGCTEVGCRNHIDIELTSDTGFGGTTNVVVETPTSIFECTFGPDSTSGASCPLTPRWGAGTLRILIPLVPDDPDSGVLALRVARVSTDPGSSDVIYFEGEDIPYSVELSWPNGPFSDPVCRRAELTLTAER